MLIFYFLMNKCSLGDGGQNKTEVRTRYKSTKNFEACDKPRTLNLASSECRINSMGVKRKFFSTKVNMTC